MRTPESLVTALAQRHAADLPALDALILERLRDTVPEFFVDADVAVDMQRAVAANVLRVHQLLLSFDQRPMGTALPADAGDLLQSTIQHGIPLISLLEAYRAAQGVASDWWQQRLDRIAPPGMLAAATSVLLRTIVAYIDAAAVQIRASYEAERRTHEGSAEGRRAHLVRRLLAGEPVQTDAAARTLNHPLDGRHIALVLAQDEDTDLDRELARIAEAMDPARVLTLPARHRTYAWLSSYGPLEHGALRGFVPTPGVLVAASGVHAGVAGFVQAHRDATRTARIAGASGAPDHVAFFEEFELATLLSREPGDRDRFLRRVLGTLADDTRAAARARETLGAYLAEGGSPTRTARRLGVHRNTVTYRLGTIRRLVDDLDGRSLELQLALHLVEQLGPLGAPPAAQA